MPITTQSLFIETDNLLEIRALKDAESDTIVNGATVVAGVYKDPPKSPNAGDSAIEIIGPAEVDIPSTAHGLVEGDKIRIHGTINYDSTFDVKAGTTADLIRISSDYVAETFIGNELIYEAVLNADSVDLTEDASTGNYSGILSDTAILVYEVWYWLIFQIDKDESRLVIRSKRKATYYG